MHILPAIFIASSAICAGRKLRMLSQRLRGRLGIRTAGADGRDSRIGLNHVALSAQKEGLFLVRNQQQRLQVPQELVGPPILRQFHSSPAKFP